MLLQILTDWKTFLPSLRAWHGGSAPFLLKVCASKDLLSSALYTFLGECGGEAGEYAHLLGLFHPCNSRVIDPIVLFSARVRSERLHRYICHDNFLLSPAPIFEQY